MQTHAKAFGQAADKGNRVELGRIVRDHGHAFAVLATTGQVLILYVTVQVVVATDRVDAVAIALARHGAVASNDRLDRRARPDRTDRHAEPGRAAIGQAAADLIKIPEEAFVAAADRIQPSAIQRLDQNGVGRGHVAVGDLGQDLVFLQDQCSRTDDTDTHPQRSADGTGNDLGVVAGRNLGVAGRVDRRIGHLRRRDPPVPGQCKATADANTVGNGQRIGQPGQFLAAGCNHRDPPGRQAGTVAQPGLDSGTAEHQTIRGRDRRSSDGPAGRDADGQGAAVVACCHLGQATRHDLCAALDQGRRPRVQFAQSNGRADRGILGDGKGAADGPHAIVRQAVHRQRSSSQQAAAVNARPDPLRLTRDRPACPDGIAKERGTGGSGHDPRGRPGRERGRAIHIHLLHLVQVQVGLDHAAGTHPADADAQGVAGIVFAAAFVTAIPGTGVIAGAIEIIGAFAAIGGFDFVFVLWVILAARVLTGEDVPLDDLELAGLFVAGNGPLVDDPGHETDVQPKRQRTGHGISATGVQCAQRQITANAQVLGFDRQLRDDGRLAGQVEFGQTDTSLVVDPVPHLGIARLDRVAQKHPAFVAVDLWQGIGALAVIDIGKAADATETTPGGDTDPKGQDLGRVAGFQAEITGSRDRRRTGDARGGRAVKLEDPRPQANAGRGPIVAALRREILVFTRRAEPQGALPGCLAVELAIDQLCDDVARIGDPADICLEGVVRRTAIAANHDIGRFRRRQRSDGCIARPAQRRAQCPCNRVPLVKIQRNTARDARAFVHGVAVDQKITLAVIRGAHRQCGDDVGIGCLGAGFADRIQQGEEGGRCIFGLTVAQGDDVMLGSCGGADPPGFRREGTAFDQGHDAGIVAGDRGPERPGATRIGLGILAVVGQRILSGIRPNGRETAQAGFFDLGASVPCRADDTDWHVGRDITGPLACHDQRFDIATLGRGDPCVAAGRLVFDHGIGDPRQGRAAVDLSRHRNAKTEIAGRRAEETDLREVGRAVLCLDRYAAKVIPVAFDVLIAGFRGLGQQVDHHGPVQLDREIATRGRCNGHDLALGLCLNLQRVALDLAGGMARRDGFGPQRRSVGDTDAEITAVTLAVALSGLFVTFRRIVGFGLIRDRLIAEIEILH